MRGTKFIKNNLDLKFLTKKEKYSYAKGRTFEIRMKLARNGEDFLTAQNEERKLIVSQLI